MMQNPATGGKMSNWNCEHEMTNETGKRKEAAGVQNQLYTQVSSSDLQFLGTFGHLRIQSRDVEKASSTECSRMVLSLHCTQSPHDISEIRGAAARRAAVTVLPSHRDSPPRYDIGSRKCGFISDLYPAWTMAAVVSAGICIMWRIVAFLRRENIHECFLTWYFSHKMCNISW